MSLKRLLMFLRRHLELNPVLITQRTLKWMNLSDVVLKKKEFQMIVHSFQASKQIEVITSTCPVILDLRFTEPQQTTSCSVIAPV